jgi:murein DD-endopeptidase MepM/ murein hydrolase activator NlpD
VIIPAIRGSDKQGRGYFGAPRGNRTHIGVDFVARPGDPVRAFLGGIVSKLGFPYADKPQFRFVEVRRPNGDAIRYFYVSPTVQVNDQIAPGEMLGTCQELPYEGITQHYHVECVVRGSHVDPIKYLSDNA